MANPVPGPNRPPIRGRFGTSLDDVLDGTREDDTISGLRADDESYAGDDWLFDGKRIGLPRYRSGGRPGTFNRGADDFLCIHTNPGG
jgi:hypothetical protein